MSGGMAVTESYQETSGALASSTDGNRIFLTGARRVMSQRKVKVKNLEATTFSKCRAHKDSDSIHVDPNYANSNQLISANLTDIGPINNSDDLHAIEKMLSWSGKSKDTTAHDIYCHW